MKSLAPFALFALFALLSVAVPVGCGDDQDDGQEQSGTGGGASDKEGLRMCCELGQLCHRVGAPDKEMEACHNLGHENDPAACRQNYERCLGLCAAGGAGGASSPHACL